VRSQRGQERGGGNAGAQKRLWVGGWGDSKASQGSKCWTYVVGGKASRYFWSRQGAVEAPWGLRAEFLLLQKAT
jgi:hypothetical protein